MKYRKDYEGMGSQGVTQGGYAQSQVWQDNKTSEHPAHKRVHQYIMEMAHRPGIIVGGHPPLLLPFYTTVHFR